MNRITLLPLALSFAACSSSGTPTRAQDLGWAAIGRRQHTLIAAPTGSGKTLAAFLTALDDLVRESISAPLPDEVRVEPGFPEQVLEGLRQRGHRIEGGPPYSSANSIEVTPKGLVGAADSRTRGATAAGF